MTTREEIAKKIYELGFATKPTKKLVDFVLSEVALAERAARVEAAKEILSYLDSEYDDFMKGVCNKIITANSEPVREGE